MVGCTANPVKTMQDSDARVSHDSYDWGGAEEWYGRLATDSDHGGGNGGGGGILFSQYRHVDGEQQQQR